MHKIVFITLYYNRSAEVDVTLQSMLAAKTENMHIIAVDDGSTDDTYQKLLQYQDCGVEVVTGENKGFTKSLCNLLEKVDSEYIAICGSGDICHKDRIRTQLDIMDLNKNIAFCGTSSRNIDIEKNQVVDYQNFKEGFLEAANFFDSPPFTHGTVMIRTSAYKAVGGYDERFYLCQDWDLWLRLLSVGDAYFINKNLYDRRLLLDGASFNAQKAELQLVYKYLALYFYKNQNINRDLYLDNFDMKNIINSLNIKNKIRSNMSSRFIKLVLLRDFKGATTTRSILNENYGGLLLKYTIVFYLIFIPIRFNIGVSFLSRFLRVIFDLFRKF